MRRQFSLSILASLALVLGTCFLQTVIAAPPPTSDFSLEVSPSIISADIAAGTKTNIELKVRNLGVATEQLKIELRSFTFDTDTQSVELSDSTPVDLTSWVHFSQPTFSLAPKAWLQQQVQLDVPATAAFSYPFAVVISREQSATSPDSAGNPLEGSIAIFALININRPGATRTLQLQNLKTSQKIYEYLPAHLSVTLENTGNSIVRPYGNVYVQRSSADTTPLTTLPLNETGAFILPNTSRTLSLDWNSGFPVYKSIANETMANLEWNWNNASHFRIGRYTAKVVAVYNDGTRDVPILGEVNFWVIPWKIMLGTFVIAALLIFALWSLVRKLWHAIKRLKKPRAVS